MSWLPSVFSFKSFQLGVEATQAVQRPHGPHESRGLRKGSRDYGAHSELFTQCLAADGSSAVGANDKKDPRLYWMSAIRYQVSGIKHKPKVGDMRTS